MPRNGLKNERGNRYGRLVVVKEDGRTASGDVLWLCRCVCGTEKPIPGRSLRTGEARSCGCLQRERTSARNTRHGMRKHYLYQTWVDLVYRCHNPRCRQFKNYGLRGIQVYEPWREDPRPFIGWIEANLGPRPEGYSLDRIDNDGNYEPGNLRWADAKTQGENKRTALYVSDDYYKLLTEPMQFVYRGGDAS